MPGPSSSRTSSTIASALPFAGADSQRLEGHASGVVEIVGDKRADDADEHDHGPVDRGYVPAKVQTDRPDV